MIEATQEKLREAGFFLRKLIHSSQQMFGEEAQAFPYYLNAFLSAGRSVTFALQFQEKQKYDSWFPIWLEKQSPEIRELLDFMKGQRNTSQKRGGAEVRHSLELVPLTRASRAEQRQMLSFEWFGPPGIPAPTIARRIRHFELGGTPAEVRETCSVYFRTLEVLVGEFLLAHATT